MITYIKGMVVKKLNISGHVGSILKNMAIITSGNVAARLISVFTVPVITRIYLPEHMGVLYIFLAITSMLLPFGCFRYHLAAPLIKNDGLAANLAVVCIGQIIIFTFIIFFIFAFFSPFILAFFSISQLLPYWWLLPLIIAGTWMYDLLYHWCIREKTFKALAKSSVLQVAVGSSVKIGLGLLGFKPFGLLIGQLFNQTGGIFLLTRVFYGKIRRNLRYVSVKRMKFLLNRFIDFPKYRLTGQFFIIFSSKMLILYFGWTFDTETTGQLGLALVVIALPMALFGYTMGQSYYAEIAAMGRKRADEIYSISKNIVKKLFFISLVPFLILLFLGPQIFQIFFGEVWYEAGVFASLLAISLLARFVSEPIVNIFTVFDKQYLFLYINILKVLLGSLSLFVSYMFDFSASITVLFFSILLSIVSVYTLFISFKTLNENFQAT